MTIPCTPRKASLDSSNQGKPTNLLKRFGESSCPHHTFKNKHLCLGQPSIENALICTRKRINLYGKHFGVNTVFFMSDNSKNFNSNKGNCEAKLKAVTYDCTATSCRHKGDSCVGIHDSVTGHLKQTICK